MTSALGRRNSLLLFVASALLLAGCAGPRIRADFDQFQARKQELTRPARAVQAASAGPYQLGVRVGPGFLDKATTALFSADLLGPSVIGQVDAGEVGRAGRFFERFSGGDSGLKPQLKASGVKIGFPANCVGCIKLQFQLEGGLSGLEMRQATLSGTLAVRARISGAEAKGKPALRFALEEVEQLNLDLPVSLPGPFNSLISRMEAGVRQKISEYLQEHPEKSAKVIPIAEKFKLGQGVVLEGLGVETAPSPGGELFIGLNTTLAAKSTVAFRSGMGGLEQSDWGILVGEDVVSSLLAQAVQAGKIPTRYDTKGKPDAKGNVGIGLKGIRFVDSGFVVDVRVWYLGWPAFWRDYALEGTLGFQDGSLKPAIVRMVAGKGDGAAWLSKLAESRMKPEKLTRGMGNTMPENLSMPLGSTARIKLLPASVTTHPGLLQLQGSVQVISGAQAEGP